MGVVGVKVYVSEVAEANDPDAPSPEHASPEFWYTVTLYGGMPPDHDADMSTAFAETAVGVIDEDNGVLFPPFTVIEAEPALTLVPLSSLTVAHTDSDDEGEIR